MTIRLSLLRLSARYRLPAPQRAALIALDGAGVPPRSVDSVVAQAMAVLAAVLAGLALIFWVAANWDALGRAGSFALLQGVVVLAVAGAYAWPRARVGCALVAFAGTGALLAYFGQTYQTGADPWQLFAWWTVLGLPLCLGVRRDALWAPWAVVAGCAILLWMRAQTGSWWGSRDDHLYFLAGWSASAAVIALLSPLARAWTGAGPWALRISALCTVMLILPAGVFAVFEYVLLAWLAFAVLAAMAAVFAGSRLFDVFILSAVGLALNVILDCALAKLLLGGRSFETGALFIIGLAAAGLLSVTVAAINKLSAHYSRQEKGRPS